MLKTSSADARAKMVIDTLVALDTMSELPRTGWLLRGIRPCESIADHSFAVAVTAMLLVDALREDGHQVDGETTLRMALIHDAPEARTGDVPMPQKTPAVRAALEELDQALAARLLPTRLAADFDRMRAGACLESRIVKAADKIQMMTKALIYERQGRGALDEFWRNPKNFKAHGIPLVEAVFASLKARHDQPESWSLDRW